MFSLACTHPGCLEWSPRALVLCLDCYKKLNPYPGAHNVSAKLELDIEALHALVDIAKESGWSIRAVTTLGETVMINVVRSDILTYAEAGFDVRRDVWYIHGAKKVFLERRGQGPNPNLIPIIDTFRFYVKNRTEKEK